MNNTIDSHIFLNGIATIKQNEWLEQAGAKEAYRLFIITSGYEARNIAWAQNTLKTFPKSNLTHYLVIGFKSFKNALSRPQNDIFYSEHDLSIQEPDTEDWADFQKLVISNLKKIINSAGENPIEVHFDYSCMPRHWYCRLPLFLQRQIRAQDQAYFWYSPGKYPETEYPTAGVEDFYIFSGRPTLSPGFRTHILGLGFDRIRSQAIWSVLDPENLICFYAEPGAMPDYVARVKSENKDILLAADYKFSVPMHDFVYTYSKIVAIVKQFNSMGDVILVPDGPKPLILAASLIPLYQKEPGLVCFHVTRRKDPDYEPVDVKATGVPYGFFFNGYSQGDSNCLRQQK